MNGENGNTGSVLDLAVVRDALRAELVARGHSVTSDTMRLRMDLYIVGPNDLASALFVFNDDAGEAAEAMYRSSGSWVEGMPPRFAVLPTAETANPAFEMIEQIRAIPLLFDVAGGVVRFPELDRLLAENIGD